MRYAEYLGEVKMHAKISRNLKEKRHLGELHID
jgi:hypothetical protein